MKKAAVALIAVLLAGCGPGGVRQQADDPRDEAPDLESAAIATGMIADPRRIDLTGLYGRDTDRLCIVPAPADFRIGAAIDYGGDHWCGASGTAVRSGDDRLKIRFDGAPGCAFEARYDGDRIVFPGRLPAACARLCRGRASLAALEGGLLSPALAEAGTLRDARGRLVCGGS